MIDCSTAGLTVSVVVPEIDPIFAVISVAPAATAVATPLELTLATAGAADDQVTNDEMSWNVPSE